ncbi:hypothetical protein RI367_006185 [Sorochytrium milnesiophthora]
MTKHTKLYSLHDGNPATPTTPATTINSKKSKKNKTAKANTSTTTTAPKAFVPAEAVVLRPPTLYTALPLVMSFILAMNAVVSVVVDAASRAIEIANHYAVRAVDTLCGVQESITTPMTTTHATPITSTTPAATPLTLSIECLPQSASELPLADSAYTEQKLSIAPTPLPISETFLADLFAPALLPEPQAHSSAAMHDTEPASKVPAPTVATAEVLDITELVRDTLAAIMTETQETVQHLPSSEWSTPEPSEVDADECWAMLAELLDDVEPVNAAALNETEQQLDCAHECKTVTDPMPHNLWSILPLSEIDTVGATRIRRDFPPTRRTVVFARSSTFNGLHNMYARPVPRSRSLPSVERPAAVCIPAESVDRFKYGTQEFDARAPCTLWALMPVTDVHPDHQWRFSGLFPDHGRTVTFARSQSLLELMSRDFMKTRPQPLPRANSERFLPSTARSNNLVIPAAWVKLYSQALPLV